MNYIKSNGLAMDLENYYATMSTIYQRLRKENKMTDAASDCSTVNLDIPGALCNWMFVTELTAAQDKAQQLANDRNTSITLLAGQDGCFYFGVASQLKRVLSFIFDFSFEERGTYHPKN